MKQNRLVERFLGLVLGVLFLTVLSASYAFAQEATGNIIGTITDEHGAVVAGAKVTATNTSTGIARNAVTDKDGNFQVLLLPIGNYKVTIEKEGFKKAVSDEQKLLINQSLKLDISLQVGGTSEQVDVTAQAATVETSNPTLGQSITSRPIVDMPLNGRNTLSLALLVPGVTDKNPGDGGAGTFNIAGGKGDSVTFLLDGGNNNNLLSNGIVMNPPPDAIAEFKILSSNYTAEYGRNGGGIISEVIKSGTNQFHGNAYEFLRNDALNANSFFNKNDPTNLLPRNVLKRNQFGFTIGGPIDIPLIVNGKDRFFFFASYQGQRQVATATTGNVTVFTPAELNGNFSGADPATQSAVAGFLQANPFFQSNPALAAQGIMDPTKINSVSQKIIAAHLLPTSPSGTLNSSGSAITNNDELDLKFDFKVTSKDTISATFGAFRSPTLNPFAGSNVPGYGDTTTNHHYYSNIGYTRVFSSTLINEARFTAQRNNNLQSVPATTLPTPSALGIGITPDNPTGPPLLSFNSGISAGFSVQGPTDLVDNTFALSDTVSWIKGTHTMKFGAYFSPYENNTVFDFFVDGNFSFTGSRTGTGVDFLDFLVGAPRSYLQFGAAPSNIRSTATYFFGQDEWKIRRNFTLTLGLRYEYSTPKSDTQGRSFSIVPNAQSTRFVNAPQGLLFPGDAGAPNGSNFPDKNDFAPRVGFAWDPWNNGKTSIRGGFGVFYDILKGEDNLQFNGQAPFFGFAFLDFPKATNGPSTVLSDPFGTVGAPNTFPSKPPAQNIDFGASGFLPFGGPGVFFVDPHLRTPYIYQYNLSIQRELTKDMVFEASYVGSSSHKLTALVDNNPFVLGSDPNNPLRLMDQQTGGQAGNFNFLDTFENVANANYNSLQTSLTRRVSDAGRLGTIYFILGYTYSHSIDSASGFRNNTSQVPFGNTGLFRTSSDFDVRHRVTFSGGWDLPFDRTWDSGPKLLTKGWSLYPIISYRTGFPMDIAAGGDFSSGTGEPGASGLGDGDIIRPNLTGTVSLFDPHQVQTFGGNQGNFFFDPSNITSSTLPSADGTDALDNAALRTYGSYPRNFLRGPGRFNMDFSIAKVTPLLRERLKMEFRADFFNIFNHTEFNNPSLNIDSQFFGQVLSTADPRIIQFAVKLAF